jgi:glutamine cyclotransferase
MKNAFSRLLSCVALSIAVSTLTAGSAMAGGSTPPGGGGTSSPPAATGPDGIFTANGDIEEWNASSGHEIASVSAPTGDTAVTTAVEANGDLYVASENSANTAFTISSYTQSLQVINANVATIDNVLAPDGTQGDDNVPSIYADGNTLYISNGVYLNTELQSLDLSSGVVTNLDSIPYDDFSISEVGGIIYASSYQRSAVETFDAATGALLNSNFITLDDGNGIGGYIAISGNDLYVDDYATNTIGEYDLTTGDAINADLVDVGSDYYGDGPLTVIGNDLYTIENNSTYEYNATTGAAIGEIAALDSLGEISSASLPLATTPEPRAWMLGSLVLLLTGVLVHRERSTSRLV